MKQASKQRSGNQQVQKSSANAMVRGTQSDKQQQQQQQQQQSQQLAEYEDQESLTLEQIIINLIGQNDIDSLKEIHILKRNLNYLEPLPELEIDALVSPLIVAIYLGRLEIVRLLLESPSVDVDLSTVDNYGYTPLAMAALSGNYEIMKILIQKGAEVNKPTLFSYTPFILCFQRLEMDSNIFENKLITFKMADLLLANGADINWIVDKKRGYTFLMYLCNLEIQMNYREGQVNLQIIKYLLENGANRAIKTEEGKTAYDLCKYNPNCEQIREMLLNQPYNQFNLKQSNFSTQRDTRSFRMDNMQIVRTIPDRIVPTHRRVKSMNNYLTMCKK